MTGNNFRLRNNVEFNEIPEARFGFPILEKIGHPISNFYSSTNT
jgi:hypothetical protein